MDVKFVIRRVRDGLELQIDEEKFDSLTIALEEWHSNIIDQIKHGLCEPDEVKTLTDKTLPGLTEMREFLWGW
jgi:hypothetical protein